MASSLHRKVLGRVQDFWSEVVFITRSLTTPRRPLPSSPRIAVHLHLYYLELADEFARFLESIDGEFDLFVTVPELHDQDRVEQSRLVFAKAGYRVVMLPHKNQGRDLGGFTVFLRDLNLEQYDLVLKLHSKMSTSDEVSFPETVFRRSSFPVTNRDLWRRHLLQCLVGSADQVKRIRWLFAPGRIGMVGDRAFHLGRQGASANQVDFSKLCSFLDVVKYTEFFAGTMFWIRADILKVFRDRVSIDSFIPTNSSQKDGAYEHAVERVFGTLVRSQGFLVKGV